MKKRMAFLLIAACFLLTMAACTTEKKKIDFSFSEYGIALENKTVDYDGNAHSIEITGTLPEGVTVSYSGNNQVEPGEYIVTAKFTDTTDTYKPIPNLTATLTINKKSGVLDGISFNDKTVTYDGNTHSIEIVGELPEGVTVSYTGNEQVNAGTYTVVANFTDTTGTYDAISSLVATLKIEKATYDMTGISLDNKIVTYDGNTHSVEITGDLPEGVTVSYTGNEQVNAGTHTVVATFTHNNLNYNDIPLMDAELKIEKATYDMSVVSFDDKTVTYDGEAHSIEITGDLPEGVTVTYTGNGKIEPGTYTVVASFTHSNANYNNIASMEATLVINPKTSYVLTYEVNGGKGQLTQECEINEVITLPTPTRIGYKFLGWTKDEESTTYITTYSQTDATDVTLYAQWEALQDSYEIASNDARVIDSINPTVIVSSEFVGGKYQLSNEILTSEYTFEYGVNAYSKLSDALDNLIEGDVIYVFGGTYTDSVTLNTKNVKVIGPNYNISSANSLRFDEATFTGDISIAADGVEINGIEIDESAVIQFTANTSDCTLKSIYVPRAVNGTPLYFFYSGESYTTTNLVIDNCRFETTTNSSGHKAIAMYGKVLNGEFTNNYFSYGTGTLKLTDMIYLKSVSGNINIIGNNLAQCVSDNLIINIATIGDDSNIKINNNIVKGVSTTTYTGPIVVGTTAMGSNVTVEVIGNELYYQDAYILKVGGAVTSLTYKYNIVVGADDLFRLDSLDGVVYDSNYSDAGSSMTVKHWQNTSTTVGTLTDSNAFASIDECKNAYLGEPYTITYELAGGTGETSQQAYKNELVGLPVLSRTGYEFLGWTKEASSTDYIFDYTQDTNDDVTLYANWLEIVSYNVTFDLDGGTMDGLSTSPVTLQVDKFSIISVATKSGYIFAGWYDELGNRYTKATDFTTDVTVKAKWIEDDTIVASFESNSWTIVGEQIKVEASFVNTPTKEIVWESLTPTIATVEDGVITGVSEGVATIVAKSPDSDLFDYEIYVTIFEEEPTGILGLIVDSNNASLYQNKNLLVGDKSSADEGGMWGYYTDVLGSVSKLFYGKDFAIDDYWLLDETETDKSYGVMEKIEFITFHYAADTPPSAYGGGSQIASLSSDLTILTDSNGDAYWQNEVSYHFGVGNDGIYSSLPENYAGWHAGTGDRITTWYPSGVMVEATDPEIPVTTLESDGYFYINGKKTDHYFNDPTKNDVTGQRWNYVTQQYDTISGVGRPLTEMGFATKVVDGQYYMPDFWYSATYDRVCSKGGNMNTIGIESSVRQNLDLWLTWQYSAQLCAHLLLKYDLPITQLVGHCFWSGKWCPQPMLENDLEIWNYFVQMVKREMIKMNKYNNYKLTLTTDSPYLESDGRVTSQPENSKCITYDVTYTDGTTTKIVTLSTIVPGTSA